MSLLREVVSRGAPLDAGDARGNTALHYALEVGERTQVSVASELHAMCRCMAWQACCRGHAFAL